MKLDEIKQLYKDYYYIDDDKIINEIYINFKDESCNIIENKPYLLGLFNLDEDIVKELINRYSSNAYKDNITFYVLKIMKIYKKNGHAFILKRDLEREIKKIFGRKEDLDEIVKCLVNDNIIIECQDIKALYLKNLFKEEKELSERVKYMLKNNINDFKEKDVIEKIDNYNEFNLTLEQKEAVKKVLKYKISILTGKAGTGKTTVLKAIIDIYKELLERPIIKLISLSGKAVRRATEAIGIEGQTIHSMLNINEDEDIRLNASPLIINADIIVIDESSMIDLILFNRLFKSLNDNCKIIMAGDYNQLPAIGVGCVFKDFIKSGIIPVAELKDVIRQEKENVIIKNASKIINGYGFSHSEGIEIKKDEFEVISYTKKEQFDKITRAINKELSRGVSIYDIQVITLERDLSYDINKYIGRIFNETNDRERSGFAVADSVIQIKNNYDKKIFNGEKGIVTRIESIDSEITEIRVKFKSGEKVYKRNELNQLELGYCLTCHKMQGSQCGTIIIVLNKSNKNLSREFLYVATTRAQRKVILIGDREQFDKGLKRVSQNRNSGLVNRLKNII